ncbi:MAG TPA: lipoprotein signal peptidase [Bacteroidales bacterium]|nr:lipoprotein signal peptidase [Bacteroidales bacterium]
MSIKLRSFLLIILVLIIDQTVKIWIKTHMIIGQEYHVFDDWFIIHFTENNGMAFGMEFGGNLGKMILSVFRIFAIMGIGWYLFYLIRDKAHQGLVLAVSLILAGAIGNMLDSAFYGILFSDSYFQVARFLPPGGGYSSFLHGRVVDMFYFPIMQGVYPSWFPFWRGQEFLFFRPVFNVADSSITIGVFIILIFQKRFFKTKQKEQEIPEASSSLT